MHTLGNHYFLLTYLGGFFYRPAKVDLPNTNTYQTIVFMQPLTSASETGGSPIVSYSLEWENGSNGASYVAINGIDSNNI